MNTPRTIEQYLQQLREALRGADPALIQDALYDAEEHLRAELHERPGRDEAAMLAHVVESYGAPDEVAEIYREQEIKVQRAIRVPRPPKPASWLGRFFGVIADGRTWGALFYMVFALASGIFYFSWVVAGVSVSFSLAIFIIGLPLIILFMGSVRGLALLEGRLVETLLGVRMPRRPPYPDRHESLLKRIGAMFTDPRSWGTLLYMGLMLPLGTMYFSLAVSLLALSVFLLALPLEMLVNPAWLQRLYVDHVVQVDWGLGPHVPATGELAVMFVVGVLLLFCTLHLARGIGCLHGALAKQLLVLGVERRK